VPASRLVSLDSTHPKVNPTAMSTSIAAAVGGNRLPSCASVWRSNVAPMTVPTRILPIYPYIRGALPRLRNTNLEIPTATMAPIMKPVGMCRVMAIRPPIRPMARSFDEFFIFQSPFHSSGVRTRGLVSQRILLPSDAFVKPQRCRDFEAEGSGKINPKILASNLNKLGGK